MAVAFQISTFKLSGGACSISINTREPVTKLDVCDMMREYSDGTMGVACQYGVLVA